jgi:beta-hydroxyacyl-ACP dehydratase FabZ
MAKVELGIEQILELLPHRYPMLLLDRVLEISDMHVVAEKFVTINEPFFQGHFPEHPIMPGVLVIEARAQAAGIGVCYSEPSAREKSLVLAGVTKARFRRPVLPGCILTLQVRQLRRRRDIFRIEGIARVDGDTVAEAELMAALVRWDEDA